MWRAINFGCAIDDSGTVIKVRHNYISYIDGDYATRIEWAIVSKEPFTMVIDFSRVTDWFPPLENPQVEGSYPTTWGEAVESRLSKQGFEFVNSNPEGAVVEPRITYPKITLT